MPRRTPSVVTSSLFTAVRAFDPFVGSAPVVAPRTVTVSGAERGLSIVLSPSITNEIDSIVCVPGVIAGNRLEQFIEPPDERTRDVGESDAGVIEVGRVSDGP